MLDEIVRKRIGVSDLGGIVPTYSGAGELGLAR